MKVRYLVAVLLASSAAVAQWSEPVNVSKTAPDRCTFSPSLAVDSAGTLHASWCLTLANDFDWIDYSCKPAGIDTWTTPMHASRDSFPFRRCVITIGPGGVPHIIWDSETEAGHIYITHKDGDTWTIPERLTTWNRWESCLRAAADRFGRIHAVWHDLTFDYIWYASYDESGWHGPEAVVYDTTPYALAFPNVAADRSGRPHIIYCWRDSVVYSFRTDTGWTVPVVVPTLHGYSRGAIITLDTSDQPHAVCHEYGYEVSHCYWTGDSWSAPVRLDSVGGYFPSVCCDSWNQVHVFFGDEGVGMRERVWHVERWTESALVDTWPGWGEPAAERTKLHLLWGKANPYGKDVWYSSRPLGPPAIEEPGTPKSFGLSAQSQNPIVDASKTRLFLDQRVDVSIEVFDSIGRKVLRKELGWLGPGYIVLEPGRLMPTPGVYYLIVRLGASHRVTRVVRID